MRPHVSVLLLCAFAAFLPLATGQQPVAVFNGTVSAAALENVVNVDSTSCPALDDTCISNKLASNTRIKVASGTTLRFNSPVTITNLQHFHLSCEPGAVLTIGALWSGSNSLITIQGGSDDVWIEDCQIQGLLYNTGTATATINSKFVNGIVNTTTFPLRQSMPVLFNLVGTARRSMVHR